MEALSLNLRLLALAGIVEPQCVAGSVWKRFLFSLYTVASVLVFMPILLGELLALYHFWGDLVVITNNVFTLVGNITFYGEALYIVSHRKDFLRLLKNLQDMLAHLPRHGTKQQMIAKQTTKHGRTLTWSMLVIVYMVPFSWSVSPLIGMLLQSHEDTTKQDFPPEEDPEAFWKGLISIMWLPLDDIKSNVREIIYVGQAMVFLITASCYVSVNTVFVALIVQSIGQFEILLDTINDMDDVVRSTDPIHCDVTEYFTNEFRKNVFGREITEHKHRHDDPSELRHYLVDVVRHHQMITAFCNQLNDLLSPLLFLYFFSAQVMMCTMAFQMALTWGEQNSFLKFGLGLLCVLAGPFFFCWQGDVLMEKSIEVHQALYGCTWYDRSETFKRTMMLVILRAQRPVSLTAGKLYIISMETFARMLNTVYYYFAVLKQLNEK